MSTTNVYNDPTMAANVTTAKEEGKHELDNAEKEYFLRDIEEKNLDPFCMFTKKQVWDKNVEFYGEPGSSRRAPFSLYLSNTIRRRKKGWKNYVDLLQEMGVDMSAHTEAKLAEELERNGGPNDAVMDESRAVAEAVLNSANERETTLKPPIFSQTYSAIGSYG